MKNIVLLFVVWMVVVNVFALIAVNRFNLEPDNAYFWINPDAVHQEQGWDILSLHAKWDSFWYIDIAEHGYYLRKDDALVNIVFFPLYPMLIAIGSFILLGNYVLAGWLLSSLFLFLALWYFYKLVKEFHPDIDPHLPLALLLIFPTAFFLNAVYTESLFLFPSIAALYHLKKKEFLKASLFGFLASATRVTGVLLVFPLAMEYLQGKKFRIREFISIRAFSVFVPVLGIGLFFLYHAVAFHDPILFFRVEDAWGRAFIPNLDHFALATNAAAVNLLLDVLFFGIAVVSTVLVSRKFGKVYGSYMAATLLVAAATGTLMSIGRYILVLFPMYIFVASLSSAYIRYVWMFISVLLFALITILFVNNYWAG